MSYRKYIFADKQFYHIYNHTVADEEIFNHTYILNRTLNLIDFYRFITPFSFSQLKKIDSKSRLHFLKKLRKSQPLVKIYSFSIMPNHFHFLLSQNQQGGVSKFISNFQNGIAKYYNLKQNRKGTLFCRPFKGTIVDSEAKFIHISRYIHLNPVTSYLIEIEDLENYSCTSFSTYMKKIDCPFIDKTLILNHFKNKERYKRFVYDQEDYQKKLSVIKRQVLEKYDRFEAN